MRLHYLMKTKHGKVHGFVTYNGDERAKALQHLDRLNAIRDEQFASRPPRSRQPYTSVARDSINGETMIRFGEFHTIEPLRELFT